MATRKGWTEVAQCRAGKIGAPKAPAKKGAVNSAVYSSAKSVSCKSRRVTKYLKLPTTDADDLASSVQRPASRVPDLATWDRIQFDPRTLLSQLAKFFSAFGGRRPVAPSVEGIKGWS